jgi:glycosyltransferase involved in cell wall biosynthesis
VKVLHVNNTDLQGRRFNGYNLIDDLRSRGVSSKQAVCTKLSKNPNVFSLWSGPEDERLHEAVARVERRRGMNNVLFPWGRVLASSPQFQAADVVHYHLLHNQVIGILDLPMLFATKPSVWTFHDPWPLTGHCIYPQERSNWLTGCNDCPHLQTQFPMDLDYAYRMWRLKERIYAELDVDIVVASEFMRDMVQRSPLTAHLPSVHLIPFGIDPKIYLPETERIKSRESFGIPAEDFVLLLRATPSEFKGLRYIVEALSARPPQRSTTLLTVDHRGLLNGLSADYRLIELGWVEDERAVRRMYSASDALLMPSIAEAFGLMALEAMAAGRPVVSFEGTSLPEITRAPQCGIAVPMGNSLALRDAIDQLSSDPGEAHRRGQLGREVASAVYGYDAYLDALTALYTEVASKERPQLRRTNAPLNSQWIERI